MLSILLRAMTLMVKPSNLFTTTGDVRGQEVKDFRSNHSFGY